MKMLKLFLLIVAINLMPLYAVYGQTYQLNWQGIITPEDEIGDACGHLIVGYFEYHITFHVNPKTGEITKEHNNLLHTELTDLNTGEELVVIDTGNDRINIPYAEDSSNWAFWHDAAGGSLSDIIPGPFPENGREGSVEAGPYKFISKGGTKVFLRFTLHFHMNASGDITVDKSKEWGDCDY